MTRDIDSKVAWLWKCSDCDNSERKQMSGISHRTEIDGDGGDRTGLESIKLIMTIGVI